MRYYTEQHEWVEHADGTATLGITGYAANELGDITFVELPEVGDSFEKGSVLCVIESVKAASDVYAPVNGEVAEVNSELEDQPELINSSAEEKGWLCKLKGVDPSMVEGLMSAEAYKSFTGSGE